MSRLHLVLLWILLPVLLLAAAFLHHFLPRHDVVRIVGTEVRRVDLDGKPGGETRDVFYVYGEDAESKKPHVYRNEDTGWGFPPYFKFNSADLQAVAASIAAEHGTAVITYYGWRINLVSLFPNVTGIKRAAANANPIPWFNIVFFIVLGLVLFFVGRGIRRIFRGRKSATAVSLTS